MSRMKFYIVVPKEAENLIANPTPYLATTGYTYTNGTLALSSDFTRRSPACLKMTPISGVASLVYYGGLPVTNGEKVSFSVDVKGVAGQAMRVYIASSAGVAKETVQFTATGNWQRISVTHKATETKSDYRVYVRRDAVVSIEPFYTDGWQFEEGEPSTFFSGDTQGFEEGEYYWKGAPHNSVSVREHTRSGGTLLDIDDHAIISAVHGLGMGSFDQIITQLPVGGGFYQGFLRKPRNFSFVLDYAGDDNFEIQANRKALLEALRPLGEKMVIRYQGYDDNGGENTHPLDIVCVPQSSHSDTPEIPVHQRAVLAFTAVTGLLDSAYTEGVLMGVNEELDLDGESNWNFYRTPEGKYYINPYVDYQVNDVLEGLGGYTYYGGRDKITIVDPDGNVTNINLPIGGSIFSIAQTPNGTVYFGGSFTSIGGVSAEHFAKMDYDGSNISPLVNGTGFNDFIRSVCVVGNDIYVGGEFSDVDGVANTNKIAMWDGSAWHPVGGGVTNGDSVWEIIKLYKNTLLIGGRINEVGGVSIVGLAIWDGNSYKSVGDLPSATVKRVLVTNSGTIYIASDDGVFRILAGRTEKMVDHATNKLTLDNKGRPMVGGDQAISPVWSIPYTVLTPKIIVYESGNWFRPDFAVDYRYTYDYRCAKNAGDNIYYWIWHTNVKKIIYPSQTEVYIDTHTYPVFTIHGPGILQNLINYTTDKIIHFIDLEIRSGEVITINLTPGNVNIKSNWIGRTNLLNYVLPGSDISDFHLRPGQNTLGVFVSRDYDNNSSATVTWKPTFESIDGALL